MGKQVFSKEEINQPRGQNKGPMPKLTPSVGPMPKLKPSAGPTAKKVYYAMKELRVTSERVVVDPCLEEEVSLGEIEDGVNFLINVVAAICGRGSFATILVEPLL
uniref:Uncharacterized protein n=1 Tax=Cannabis sativa TaxID=3483 RepID=A0A803QFI1_CANSA